MAECLHAAPAAHPFKIKRIVFLDALLGHVILRLQMKIMCIEKHDDKSDLVLARERGGL